MLVVSIRINPVSLAGVVGSGDVVDRVAETSQVDDIRDWSGSTDKVRYRLPWLNSVIG